MPRPNPIFIALSALSLLTAGGIAQSYSRINKLFDGGTGFYHSFRIPSIVRASGSVLIAFAEGRVASASDWGNINLVFKRSTDNGATWSSLREIAGVGPGGWTNPTAVYEAPWPGHPRGRVHLFFNWNSGTHTSMSTIGHGDRRTYYTYSDDDGLTFAQARNLTATLLPPAFTWDAVGPGAGIQKRLAPNAGRLIVPATKRNFHSDDHGQTWSYTMMPTVDAGNLTGESTIAECVDGSLVRNDRATGSAWPGAKRRWVSRGQIGAFPTPAPHPDLLDPRNHAALLRYNLPNPPRLIFLNSDSTVNRRRMKVRMSYDDGVTWPRERWLYVGTPPDFHATPDTAMHAGKGGYSAMTKTADFHVAAMVEVNEGFTNPGSTHQSIDFHRFNLAWILNGQSDPPCATLTNAVVSELANVTEEPFVFVGTRLDLVTSVLFDGVPITSQSSSTWASGWFRKLGTDRIEVFPPLGLRPGAHSVAVATADCATAPLPVTLRLNRIAVLVGPSRVAGPFELIGAIGDRSAATQVVLAVSLFDRPTVIPGIVSLGIGNQATALIVLGNGAPDPTTGVFGWRFPPVKRLPPLFFQSVLYDPKAAQPLPLPVTNVRLVAR